MKVISIALVFALANQLVYGAKETRKLKDWTSEISEYWPQAQSIASQYAPQADQVAQQSSYSTAIPKIEEEVAGGSKQLAANYAEVSSSVQKYLPQVMSSYPKITDPTSPSTIDAIAAYAAPGIKALNGQGYTIDLGKGKTITIGHDGAISTTGISSKDTASLQSFFQGKMSYSSLDSGAQEYIKEAGPELNKYYKSQGTPVQSMVQSYLSPEVWQQIPSMSYLAAIPTVSTTPATPATSAPSSSATVTISSLLALVLLPITFMF